MKYKIYQINFSAAMVKRINAYEPTATKVFNLYLDTMGINPQVSDIMKAIALFRHVADIEADRLDEVFHIGNMGPEDKITRHRQMHSLSVGDVIVSENGTASFVAPFGFKDVPDFVETLKDLELDNSCFDFEMYSEHKEQNDIKCTLGSSRTCGCPKHE